VSANKESLESVLTVALGLCIVCSVIVSSAAVVLKPQQEANKARDLKRNILMAGGLYDPELTVEEQTIHSPSATVKTLSKDSLLADTRESPLNIGLNHKIIEQRGKEIGKYNR